MIPHSNKMDPSFTRHVRFFCTSLKSWGTLVFLACMIVLSAPPAQCANLQSVVVALPATAMLFAPFYVAADKRFYKKHNLNVSTRLVVGPASANAVLSGSADFSAGSGITVLHAVAMGAPLIAIAESSNQLQMRIIVTRNALSQMSVGPNSPFEARVRALKGRIIAVGGINGITDAFLRYVLGRVGLTQNQIRLTTMQPDAMLAALHTGTIDGISLNAPTTTQAIAAGNVILVNDPAQEKPLVSLNPFAYNLVLTTDNECKSRPAVCVDMIKALKEAEVFMAAHPTESIAMLRPKFSHLSADILERAFHKTLEASNASLLVSARSMENAKEFSIAASILKPTQRLAPLRTVYTNAYNQ